MINSNPLSPLVRAIRTHLQTPASIAVGVALVSTTAAQAGIPQPGPEKFIFRMETATTNRELVFVDADVSDPKLLLRGLKQGVETVILEPDHDGLQQITAVLKNRTQISAVHILAHGEDGLLKLGNTRLDRETLNRRALELQGWFRDSGAGKPDLLLYACDVAKTDAGEIFVEQLAALTGADVAASTNTTGAAGDWVLEYRTGTIETAVAFKEEDLLVYPHNLAGFIVTSTADTAVGACDADCTLREAVAAANAAGGTDTITFSVSGTITLTQGQISVDEDLVVNGPGAAMLTISGNNASRIFEFTPGTGNFTVRDLTLTNGSGSGDGGAINSFCCSSTVRIEDSVITGNTTSGNGGGIAQAQGDLYVVRTEVSYNYSEEDGGGISHYADGNGDELFVTGSLITHNEAGSDGGGIARYADDEGSTTTIYNSEISHNTSDDDGGGLFIYADDEGYYTYINYSTISNNSAGDDGGGIFHYTDDDGYLVINRSTISGNHADEYGGGIFFYSDDGALEINNSTISGNDAGYNGGGIRIGDAESGVRINNSTIVFNRSSDYGGGISNDAYENLYIYNSIVADNTASNGGNDIYSNGSVTSRYSLIGDTSNLSISNLGGSIFNTASGVSPTLVDAGGVTMVHPLFSNSPAVNSGEPGFTDFDYDQRGLGFPRVTEGRLDMGAVEGLRVVQQEIPTLQNWALILLGLMLPGLALAWRKRLEERQLKS